jgi:hypothetical protein
MKPKLKLGFTDCFNPIDEYFIDILSVDYDIIRDDGNPDYLIFCDENFGTNNLKYDQNRVKKIFFTGENRRPWNYQAHHAITFDHLDSSQFFRLPLYVCENWVNQKKLGWQDYRHFTRTMRASDKTGFCSFVARNGGCQERNDIFHKLSKYKTVDAGGTLFNNIGEQVPQDGFNSHISKVEFLKPRKFHLAYENGSYPGYVTEKILHGFLGHSIPIYWGSPCVEMDFNPKAFVNRHDFNTDEDMLRYIELLDQNDDLYNSMISEPILNPRNKFLDLDRFRRWFRTYVYMESK